MPNVTATLPNIAGALCSMPHSLVDAHFYRVAQKIDTIFVRLNFDQILTDFQNYFTIRIRRKFVIILSPKIPPHLKCVAALPCEMSSVLKATTENKTTSVTHFKKLTTGNNVFIVSVIVWRNCHIMQFLHQMFNVSALLLDDTLKTAMLLTNGTINEMLTFHKVV